MFVTVTDFQADVDKYLAMVNQEDIWITKNGAPVAQIIPPKKSAVDSLRGILKGLPTNISKHSIRQERLARYENTL